MFKLVFICAYDFRYPLPKRAPFSVVKLIMSINQADKLSMRISTIVFEKCDKMRVPVWLYPVKASMEGMVVKITFIIRIRMENDARSCSGTKAKPIKPNARITTVNNKNCEISINKLMLFYDFKTGAKLK
jgi:hypothetical protein